MATVGGQFTWGNIGVIAAITAQLVGGIAYITEHDAQYDARIGAVERQQISMSVAIQGLNDAKEKTEIHLTQVDDKLESMNGKIDAILDIVQRMEQNIFNGGTANQNRNFIPKK